jgi:hypothetical protein
MVRFCGLRQDAFGLFDEHSAVQSILELLSDEVGLATDPLVQDADRRDIRERLDDRGVAGAEFADPDPEQIHRADHLAAQPHRSGEHRQETLIEGGGPERGPPAIAGFHVRNGHRHPGPEAIQAGTQNAFLDAASNAAPNAANPVRGCMSGYWEYTFGYATAPLFRR